MGKIVGILSMQRVINYGSFLQAYALKQLLLQNGAKEVYFIDIEKGRPLLEYRSKPLSLSQRIIRQVKLIFQGTFLSNLRDKKFMLLLCKSIEDCYPLLEDNRNLPSQFDLVVIGSDEVFNCCQASSWGYTLQLYGQINNAKEVISYAGSFGHTTYEQLISYGIDKEIGATMKTLKAISVRDENSSEIVEKLMGIKPRLDLDPVLIYGFSKEIMQTENVADSKYMVVYSYFKRFNDRNEIAAIRAFAKKKQLKLYSIYCRYDWCDKAIIPNTPFEVLNWFNQAEYVATDTFHGTIFSMISQTNFCTFIRKSNKQKLTSLLEGFSLRNRAVSANMCEEFEEIMTSSIDWNAFQNKLASERERVNRYLKEFL